MNEERLRLKGQLAETNKKIRSLELEASGLIPLIRDVLDPYEDDVAQIRIDKAEAYFDRLKCVVAELRTLKEKSSRLEAAVE
jgi:hypothetical protein